MVEQKCVFYCLKREWEKEKAMISADFSKSYQLKGKIKNKHLIVYTTAINLRHRNTYGHFDRQYHLLSHNRIFELNMILKVLLYIPWTALAWDLCSQEDVSLQKLFLKSEHLQRISSCGFYNMKPLINAFDTSGMQKLLRFEGFLFHFNDESVGLEYNTIFHTCINLF